MNSSMTSFGMTAPKPAKPTKQAKPKATKQPTVSKTTTKQPTISKTKAKNPKPAPSKPHEKKHKPVSESSKAPPLAKRAKAGKVVKKRTVKSSKQLVDEFVDKGVPAAKPSLEDTNEAILQKVPGKGKEKRRTLVPSEPAGHEEFSSLYAELGLSGSDTESDEEMPSVVKSVAQDEGQAGPNPDDVAESQPLPTPSVLARPNLEHSDIEITDASSQLQPEHMDDGFIATAYPKVQENLKLTADEQMIPEEPVSFVGTLSSLQHLTKDFSYGDQFIEDKPSEANNEKVTTDTEAESMVSITIQQDTSVIPPMTSPVIGLVPRPDSPNVHSPLPTTTTTTTTSATTTTTTLPLPPQPQQGPLDPIIIKRIEELKELIMNLEETKKKSKQDSPKTPPGSPPSPPPPPLPPLGTSGASGTSEASDSAQAPPLPPPSSSTHQG
ncbi:hypothetical protein Tco_1469933, partial [Tanacetum coccineum]